MNPNFITLATFGNREQYLYNSESKDITFIDKHPYMTKTTDKLELLHINEDDNMSVYVYNIIETIDYISHLWIFCNDSIIIEDIKIIFKNKYTNELITVTQWDKYSLEFINYFTTTTTTKKNHTNYILLSFNGYIPLSKFCYTIKTIEIKINKQSSSEIIECGIEGLLVNGSYRSSLIKKFNIFNVNSFHTIISDKLKEHKIEFNGTVKTIFFMMRDKNTDELLEITDKISLIYNNTYFIKDYDSKYFSVIQPMKQLINNDKHYYMYDYSNDFKSIQPFGLELRVRLATLQEQLVLVVLLI
jgi:hypothetical protein